MIKKRMKLMPSVIYACRQLIRAGKRHVVRQYTVPPALMNGLTIRTFVPTVKPILKILTSKDPLR